MRRTFLSLGVFSGFIFSVFFVARLISNGSDPLRAFHVDFDRSMNTAVFPKWENDQYSQNMLRFFRQLYNRNSLAQVRASSECKIPKIFHYIWLGVRLPDKYRPFLQTWLDKHSDWTFLFWVDNPENYDLGTLVEDADLDVVQKLIDQNELRGKRLVFDVKHLQFPNRVFFDGTKNYGERSDILRWELAYRFGGVYIDVDCECYKPLDPLNYRYDFYTGIQPLDTAAVQLGAALFGSIPGHPIVRRCVNTIKDGQKYKQIVIRTGPIHFTRAFAAVAGKTGRVDVAFPASYFYPCGYEQAGKPQEEWLQAESFATHHWAGSWLKEEGWDRTKG